MISLLASTSLSLTLAAQAVTQESFTQEWTQKGLSPEYIELALSKANHNPKVIEAITTPWEAKPWYQYKQLFLTEERVQDGVAFWKKHQQTLARAEKEYGVEAQMIVAIIGIETRYGQFTGTYPVLDALYTLGFSYPKRAKFFASELGHYLMLAQEEGWELTDVKGSYAGAMGWGQFISSSYRAYAVDFDGDGKRDLLNNPVDAIGSVANYFKNAKWQHGLTPAYPLAQSPEVTTALKWNGKPITATVAQLKQAGVAAIGDDTMSSAILTLDASESEKQGFQVTNNFYSITRYNRSPLYAMAAFEFSQLLNDAFKP